MLIDRDCFHDCEITIFLIMHCVGARKTPALSVLLFAAVEAAFLLDLLRMSLVDVVPLLLV